MKPFLYLDNWHARQQPTKFDRYLTARGLNIETRCTNDGDFPTGTDYCGVYISPSFDGAYDDVAWIHRTHELLRDLSEAGVPMLGLCFGSQVLASALVARDQVFMRDEREKGFGWIKLTDDAEHDAIAGGLPRSMRVFHWHGDEVRAGHNDIIVLADSDDCGNQLWRWAKGPVWGVQVHAELDRTGLLSWFGDNRAQFESGGLDYETLVAENDSDSVAFDILKNYVDRVILPAG